MDNLEIDERAKIVAFINLHKTQRTSVSKEFERALDEELEVKNMMINSVISDSAVVKQSFINKTTIAKYTDTARVNTKCKEQFNDFIQELTDMRYCNVKIYFWWKNTQEMLANAKGQSTEKKLSKLKKWLRKNLKIKKLDTVYI